MRALYLPTILSIFFLFSCHEKAEEPDEQEELAEIATVRNTFAPDGRIALFDVEAEKRENAYVLRGETNMPQAAESLRSKLDSAKVEYVDSIQVLPAKELGEQRFGIVGISVANLRDEPKHSAQLVTQATLGTPVKVLKKEDSWYFIQVPDGYLAWVDAGGVDLKTQVELDEWKASEKLIFTEQYGKSFSEARENSTPVSDLVLGNILELKTENGNFYEVVYPDGRTAFIPTKSSAKYADWIKTEKPAEKLVSTAQNLMGLPYLWGGTSAKGVDCSGYTKTVYFMNGYIIPRDASQQVREGILIDSTKNFSNLEKGDLLFFGRPATDSTSERVVHVGMWIGNNEFIHSSGDVHISSMDSLAENFDEYNLNRYLRTKRIFGKEDKGLINMETAEIFNSPAKDSTQAAQPK